MLVREHEPHCISDNCPSRVCCTKQYPIPYSREASVRRMVCRSASKGLTIVLSDVSVFLTRMKSSSCSESQSHAVPFLSSSLILLSMWDRSGMKAPSCCARPKNDLKSEVLLGLGKSVTALYLSSFGRIPWSEIMCPAKSSVDPISNFLREIVTLCCLHRSTLFSLFVRVY